MESQPLYPDPRTYLWANICALMARDPENDPPAIDVVAARIKIGRGTIQRIKAGEPAGTLTHLYTIAEKLGVPVWRLLQPAGALSGAAIQAGTLYDKIKNEAHRKMVADLLEALQPPNPAPAVSTGEVSPAPQPTPSPPASQ